MILAISDFRSESNSINIFPAWILDKGDTFDTCDTCKAYKVCKACNTLYAMHYRHVRHKKRYVFGYSRGHIIPWKLKEHEVSSHPSYS
jgi:hypothetical protein